MPDFPESDFLETAPLVGLSQIHRDTALLPAARGIYGLFFRIPPGPVPTAGCLGRAGLWLLYIGTAGADLAKSGTLRRRLGTQHLGGNERRSTLCQTLAALLPEVAGPAIARNERGRVKYHTSPEGAERLRRWMDANVSACWTACARPAELEERLIRRYDPPLNIDFCVHPFASRLSALREERRKSAGVG